MIYLQVHYQRNLQQFLGLFKNRFGMDCFNQILMLFYHKLFFWMIIVKVMMKLVFIFDQQGYQKRLHWLKQEGSRHFGVYLHDYQKSLLLVKQIIINFLVTSLVHSKKHCSKAKQEVFVIFEILMPNYQKNLQIQEIIISYYF